MVSQAEITQALARLDEITRRLRRECPWDREQDERTIVPHTLEEAYELADAAQRGDDAKLLDELGDVLFQVHFLSLLLEERGAGDLAAVAEHCRQKLIRRHPHVFGEVEVANAGEVLANWDEIKRAGGRAASPASSARCPRTSPAPARPQGAAARRVGGPAYGAEDPRERRDNGRPAARDATSRHEIGDALFAAVDVARASVDPELALRAAADRFRARVESRPETARSP